jgi:hypothetical protein
MYPANRFPAEAGIFLLATVSRPVLELTQLLVPWVPGAMRPDHETSSAEIKNMWTFTSITS